MTAPAQIQSLLGSLKKEHVLPLWDRYKDLNKLAQTAKPLPDFQFLLRQFDCCNKRFRLHLHAPSSRSSCSGSTLPLFD